MSTCHDVRPRVSSTQLSYGLLVDHHWRHKDQGIQKVAAAANKEEGFRNLLPSEILPAANNNIKLEYAFYSLGKKVRALMADQKLRCSDI